MASFWFAGGFQHLPFGRLKDVQFEKLPLRQRRIGREVALGDEVDEVGVVEVGVVVVFALPMLFSQCWGWGWDGGLLGICKEEEEKHVPIRPRSRIRALVLRKKRPTNSPHNCRNDNNQNHRDQDPNLPFPPRRRLSCCYFWCFRCVSVPVTSFPNEFRTTGVCLLLRVLICCRRRNVFR